MRRKTTNSPRPRTPALAFSGERHKKHFAVKVFGERILVPYALLRGLLDLVLARARPGTGFVPMRRMLASRIRSALTRGDSQAGGLIETGCKEEYRLAIPPQELNARVAFEASFAELANLEVLTLDEIAALEEGWGQLLRAGTERIPYGYVKRLDGRFAPAENRPK